MSRLGEKGKEGNKGKSWSILYGVNFDMYIKSIIYKGS